MKFRYAFLLFAFSTSLHAKDWSRYRGPNGTGISDDAGVVTEWDAQKNIKWQVKLPGAGSSSPIVSKGKIFVASYSGYGADGGSVDKLERHLTCIDHASGKIEWTKTVKARLPEDPYSGFLTEHGYASNTPVADGEHVYVFFGKSGVYAYDFSGEELWNKHLGSESTGKRWGSAASPILVGKYLVVNAAEESRAVYGLDKMTGEEVWKAEADSLAYAYSTPSMLVRKEGPADLVLPVPGELWGLDPETGKLRWWADTGLTGNYASPVLAGGNYYGVSRNGGTFVIKATPKFEVIAHNKIASDKSQFNATPAMGGGDLFLRSDSTLYCVGTK